MHWACLGYIYIRLVYAIHECIVAISTLGYVRLCLCKTSMTKSVCISTVSVKARLVLAYTILSLD